MIRMYEVIRDNVDELIEELEKHPNDEEHFYSVRDWDRNPVEYARLTKIQKAARIIYLNKTCYNGLFRVNNAGEFNTPFGHYKNPNIVNAPTLKAVSLYFNTADISFTTGDYSRALENVKRGHLFIWILHMILFRQQLILRVIPKVDLGKKNKFGFEKCVTN